MARYEYRRIQDGLWEVPTIGGAWTQVDDDYVTAGADDDDTHAYWSRYDAWEAHKATLALEADKAAHKEQAKQDLKAIEAEAKARTQSLVKTDTVEGYKGYQHTPSNYSGGYGQSNYSYSNYTYYPTKLMDGVDRKKWPSTWNMLLRFCYSDRFHQETRYVHENFKDWRTRAAERKEETKPIRYNRYDG